MGVVISTIAIIRYARYLFRHRDFDDVQHLKQSLFCPAVLLSIGSGLQILALALFVTLPFKNLLDHSYVWMTVKESPFALFLVGGQGGDGQVQLGFSFYLAVASAVISMAGSIIA